MHDSTKFQGFLGKEKQYSNFLAFFQNAIDTKGVSQVLEEYLFAGDDRAETMLSRLFGGMLPFRKYCTRQKLTVTRTGTSAHPPRLWARVQPTCHCGPGFSPSRRS